MPYSKVYLPKLDPLLKTKIIEDILRAKIFQKQTSREVVYAIKLSRSERILFVSKSIKGSQVLIYLDRFSSHDDYVHYLSKSKSISTPSVETLNEIDLESAVSAESSEAQEDHDEVCEVIEYRECYLELSQAQEAILKNVNDILMESGYSPLGNSVSFHNPHTLIIKGHAGTGKTLLAQLLCLHNADENCYVLYLCPSLMLANAMREILEEKNVHHVKCVALTEICKQTEGENNYQQWCKLFNNDPDSYQKICQLAALKSMDVQQGELWQKLLAYNELLNGYTSWLQINKKIDLNLGIGFPAEYFNHIGLLCVDEFQQFPAPLQRFISQHCKGLRLIFGDPDQTLDTAMINHIKMNALYGATVREIELQEGYRNNRVITAAAKAVLEKKRERFKLKHAVQSCENVSQNFGRVWFVSCASTSSKPIPPAIPVILVDENLSLPDWLNNLSQNTQPISGVLGAEYDSVIIYITNNIAKKLSQTLVSTKAESYLNKAEDIILYNALYVALTRARKNVIFIMERQDLLSKFFEGIPTFCENLDSIMTNLDRELTAEEVSKLIRQEIEQGRSDNAKSLYDHYKQRFNLSDNILKYEMSSLVDKRKSMPVTSTAKIAAAESSGDEATIIAKICEQIKLVKIKGDENFQWKKRGAGTAWKQIKSNLKHLILVTRSVFWNKLDFITLSKQADVTKIEGFADIVDIITVYLKDCSYLPYETRLLAAADVYETVQQLLQNSRDKYISPPITRLRDAVKKIIENDRLDEGLIWTVKILHTDCQILADEKPLKSDDWNALINLLCLPYKNKYAFDFEKTNQYFEQFYNILDCMSKSDFQLKENVAQNVIAMLIMGVARVHEKNSQTYSEVLILPISRLLDLVCQWNTSIQKGVIYLMITYVSCYHDPRQPTSVLCCCNIFFLIYRLLKKMIFQRMSLSSF